MNNQKGAIPVLILLAGIGLLIFILVTNTFDFKNYLFNRLFPKPPSHAQEVSPSVPDEILLKFKPGVSEEAKENIRNSHGIKKEKVIEQIDVELGKVPAEARDKIIEALRKNPQIEFAEPNFIVKAQLSPNDTYYTIGRQWAPTKINAPSAWDISTGSTSAVIAILDSGVNYNHEDLLNKFIGTPDLDDYGHGTWVAGIAGAIGNNGKGVAGICWLCPMLSIKMLDSTGSGTVSGSASAIVSAANQGVKVINMSWGCFCTDNTTMQTAVDYAWGKGAVLVGGAGNNNSSTTFTPAGLNNVIAVGGTDSSDKLFALSTNPNYASNYGPWIDVVAPGAGVYTTNMGGGYEAQTGTSFASPHVAGLAGLIFSANPSLTNQQVVDIIISTALDLGTTGKDDLYGYGRIDAAAALQKAIDTTPAPTPTATPIPSPTPTPIPTSTPTPTDTTPPTVSITNPLGGTVKINSTVNITASATDNIGVSKVEFYVNNSLKCTSSVTPYTCSWKVPGKKNTSYSISAKAYDLSGNTNSSLAVKVTAQ